MDTYMQEKFMERKPTRLKNFDYSTTGAYFITICVRDKKQNLSIITREYPKDANETSDSESVGEGLAPPAPRLTHIGKIVEEQISAIEERYKNILIDEYVIMPDHLHLLILINNAGGASPSPTVNDVICSFKSLTSIQCKRTLGIEKIFQRSFYDHVIRNQKDYDVRKKYIRDNPLKWYYGL